MKLALKKIVLMVCGWLLMPATAVFAEASNDAYTIESISITLPSGLQHVRRREAISQATTQGLEQLLKNLTPHHVWSRHGDVMATIDTSNIIDRMVIVEETPSPQYNVTLHLTFNRDVLRQTLTSLQIPYSEAAPTEMLLLPLFDFQSRRMLWEETNPWRMAFDGLSEKSGLLNFTLPLGDANEMRMLSADMVAYGAADMMMELAGQYELAQVLVAKAELVQQFGYQALDVQSEWHTADGIATFRFRVPFQEGQALEDVLKMAASRVLTSIEEQVRSASLVEVDKPGRVFLRYDPVDATDLERMKAILQNINIIKQAKLRMLSLDNAVFQVNYFGAPDDLMRQLLAEDLQLMKQGNLWHIRFKPKSDMLKND